MAIVRVTPIALDSVVVIPSILRPADAVSWVINQPIAPMLPSNILMLRACRPGNKVGGEANKPAKQNYQQNCISNKTILLFCKTIIVSNIVKKLKISLHNY